MSRNRFDSGMLANGMAGLLGGNDRRRAATPSSVSEDTVAPAETRTAASPEARHHLRGRRPDGVRDFWTGKTDYRTSLCADRAQYERVADAAYRERVSMKEMIYRLLETGLAHIDEAMSLEQ